MDFSEFNFLDGFLIHLKDWVSFLTAILNFLPSFFVIMLSIFFLSLIIIGLLILIFKLIG